MSGRPSCDLLADGNTPPGNTSTWDASLQISFVDAMNARNAHMKVAACLERVRLGHRRK